MMLKSRIAQGVTLLFAALATQTPVMAAPATAAKNYLNKPAEWYASDEAKRIAHNILSFQTPDGAWPKNIDTAATKTAETKTEEDHGTFDNGATVDELRYVARMYDATKDARYEQSFRRGLDAILKAQYPNGGFPQYYPVPAGAYNRYITYNDGTMVRLMFFLKEVGEDKAGLYPFISAGQKRACLTAWDKGIDCILKTQVKVDGKLTAWCAQHDEKDLSPKPARNFEPMSLSGCETVGVVHALMAVEKPSPEIVKSVDAAVSWLDSVKIPGIKVEDRPQQGTPRGYERYVVKDPSAPPMWARFYEIGTNRPIFCGRDKVVKYDLSEIEIERRTGYQWLKYWPKNLIEKEYPEWKAKVTTQAAR